ncbi:hypothetical protein BB560_000563 [Smittium megazygosporum]|uniref:Uncharacterized protein n=1 Tax=Smittium megazygosporum TaxID=133381 RepID=A0A2T9ZJZ7_9FUNG|nr:hypothetical protein BB560_000563 [Smittium megazygosporum]
MLDLAYFAVFANLPNRSGGTGSVANERIDERLIRAKLLYSMKMQEFHLTLNSPAIKPAAAQPALPLPKSQKKANPTSTLAIKKHSTSAVFQGDPSLLETILLARIEENRSLTQREIRKTEQVRLKQRHLELEILKQSKIVPPHFYPTKEGPAMETPYREPYRSDPYSHVYDTYYDPRLKRSFDRTSVNPWFNRGPDIFDQSTSPYPHPHPQHPYSNNPRLRPHDYRKVQVATQPGNSTAETLVSPLYPRNDHYELPSSSNPPGPGFAELKAPPEYNRQNADTPITPAQASVPRNAFQQQPGRPPYDIDNEPLSKRKKALYAKSLAVSDPKAVYYNETSQVPAEHNRLAVRRHNAPYYTDAKRNVSVSANFHADNEPYVSADYLKKGHFLKQKIPPSSSNLHRLSSVANGLMVKTNPSVLQKSFIRGNPRDPHNSLFEADPMSAPVDSRPLKKHIVLSEDVIKAIRKKALSSDSQANKYPPQVLEPNQKQSKSQLQSQRPSLLNPQTSSPQVQSKTHSPQDQKSDSKDSLVKENSQKEPKEVKKSKKLNSISNITISPDSAYSANNSDCPTPTIASSPVQTHSTRHSKADIRVEES